MRPLERFETHQKCLVGIYPAEWTNCIRSIDAAGTSCFGLTLCVMALYRLANWRMCVTLCVIASKRPPNWTISQWVTSCVMESNRPASSTISE